MKRIVRLAVMVAVALLAHSALAQNVARIAVLEGGVERGRAGAWAPLQLGAELGAGDELRTDASGRARLVLPDGSVITVGRSTHLVIATLAGAAEPATLVHLDQGSVRPVVAPQGAGHSFAIDTPTALATVRGTEFVVVYNPVAETSDVVGVSETVSVSNVQTRVRGTVLVTTQQLTTVARGKPPTPPKAIPAALFRQYIEGLQFVGEGEPESLTTGSPLLSGAEVPVPDRSEAQPAPGANPLDLSTPGDFLKPKEGSSAGRAGQPPNSVGGKGGATIHF
jgi:hypothetical protein